MNIPIELIAVILAALLGAIVTLLAWLVKRVFKLEARLSLLIAVMQDHFGFRIPLPSGDTDRFLKV